MGDRGEFASRFVETLFGVFDFLLCKWVNLCAVEPYRAPTLIDAGLVLNSVGYELLR